MQSGHWVFSSLVILLAIIAAPCAGWAEGGIVFGEPVVVEPGLGPVPAGDFRNEQSLLSHLTAASDSLVLLLATTPTLGMWSMVRMSLVGDLLDTVPRQLRSPSYEYLGATYGLTWEAPYFYLWEGGGGKVYYTRIAEDLTVIDAVPRQLAPATGGVIVGGSQVWIVNSYGGVQAFDARTDSAMFAQIQLSHWSSVTGSSIRGVVHDGLYVMRWNTSALVAELAYVSETGQASALAPGNPAVVPRGAFYFSGDSAVFWSIGDNGISDDLRWFFVSPSDSLCAATSYNVPLQAHQAWPEYVIGLYDQRAIIASRTSTGEFYRWSAAVVDLSGDSIVSRPELGIDHSYATSLRALRMEFSADSGYIFYSRQNGIHVLPLAGPDFWVAGNRRAVLWGKGHQGEPSAVADTGSILVCTAEGHIGGTRLAGYRWTDFSLAGLANPVRYDPNPNDSDVSFPAAFRLGNMTGLYWFDRLDDSPEGIKSRFEEQRFCVFADDFPSESQMAGAFKVDTSEIDPRAPVPAAARIGDSVYIASHSGGGVWMLRTIDLASSSVTPAWSVVYSGVTPMLRAYGDTLIRSGTWESCYRECGNIGCCEYNFHVFTRESVGTSQLAYWQRNLPGTYTDWPYHVPSMFSCPAGDGTYYLPLSYPAAIARVDLETRTTETVAHLEPLLGTSSYDGGFDLEVRMARVAGYYVVFVFRTNQTVSEAFVFDHNWQLCGKADMSVSPLVDDVANVVPIPGTDTLLLVYTAWLPYPYSSERLIVQKVWLDLATDIDPDVPLLPGTFAVKQNYPNPFNARTIIEFSLPQRTEVTLEVCNILGQIIRTWGPEEYGPGVHTIEWDGRDDRHRMASTGVYLYRVSTSKESEVRKMLLLK